MAVLFPLASTPLHSHAMAQAISFGQPTVITFDAMVAEDINCCTNVSMVDCVIVAQVTHKEGDI